MDKGPDNDIVKRDGKRNFKATENDKIPVVKNIYPPVGCGTDTELIKEELYDIFIKYE